MYQQQPQQQQPQQQPHHNHHQQQQQPRQTQASSHSQPPQQPHSVHQPPQTANGPNNSLRWRVMGHPPPQTHSHHPNAHLHSQNHPSVGHHGSITPINMANPQQPQGHPGNPQSHPLQPSNHISPMNMSANNRTHPQHQPQHSQQSQHQLSHQPHHQQHQPQHSQQPQHQQQQPHHQHQHHHQQQHQHQHQQPHQQHQQHQQHQHHHQQPQPHQPHQQQQQQQHQQPHIHAPPPHPSMPMPIVVSGPPPPPPHHMPLQNQHNTPIPQQQLPPQHHPQQTPMHQQGQNISHQPLPQQPSPHTPMHQAPQSHLSPISHQHHMAQPPIMISSPYPYNSPMMFPFPIPSIPSPYPVPGHLQPNSAMFHHQTQVITNELGGVQHFNPQNRDAAINGQPPMGQTPLGPKPPTASLAPPPVPQPPRVREKKIAIIKDPKTLHKFTLEELQDSTKISHSQSSSSKDSGVTGSSSNNPSLSSDEDSSTDGTTTATATATATTTATTTATPTAPVIKAGEQIETTNNIEKSSPEKSELPTSSNPIDETVSKKIEEKSTTDTLIENGHTLLKEDGDTSVSISDGVDDKENAAKEHIESTAAEMSKLTLCDDKDESDLSNDQDELAVDKQCAPSYNLPYAAGQFSPLNKNGKRKYSIEFLKAVATEKMGIEFSITNNVRFDFTPHYMNQNYSGSHKDYPTSQPLMRRSSQQMPVRRKVIETHSLHQEPELRTVENPWKPELEVEKSKQTEAGEMDTKRLLKVFRGHLNKLTPQKYESIIEKIESLDLLGPERLNNVINLVFDKAVDEPGFCELYAKMCKVIAKKESQFCYHLVRKCQDAFETTDLYDGLRVDARKNEIDGETDPNKKKQMTEELYEDMRLRRKKYLGTIKLIGEMYKLGLLAAKIIGLCMRHLLLELSNENIECLCSLITTIGHKMAKETEPNIYESLKATLIALSDIAHSRKQEENFILESRIKFKILDTVDLYKRNWKPRMVENNPKKIEEIRDEAKEELSRQAHHNYTNNPHKSVFRYDERERDRRRLNNPLPYSSSKPQGWNK